MYFDLFDKVLVRTNRFDPASMVVLTDITKNVRFKKEIVDRLEHTEPYLLSDNETLEHVSEKLYGSPYYHWVLMLLNDIYDVNSDMPLSAALLEQRLQKKYNPLHLLTHYGATRREQVVVDILRHRSPGNVLRSALLRDQELMFRSRVTAAAVTHRISSFAKFDRILNTYIINFLRTDAAPNTWVDLSSWSPIVSGALVPQVLGQREIEENERKRNIRVLVPEMLVLVLNNFKELMGAGR